MTFAEREREREREREKHRWIDREREREREREKETREGGDGVGQGVVWLIFSFFLAFASLLPRFQSDLDGGSSGLHMLNWYLRSSAQPASGSAKPKSGPDCEPGFSGMNCLQVCRIFPRRMTGLKTKFKTILDLF